jgi:tyrosinase
VLNITRRSLLSSVLAIPAAKIALASNTVRLRPATHTEAGQDMLRRYGVAVARMKALPPYHPHSWFFQACIHGKPHEGDPNEPSEDEVFSPGSFGDASAAELRSFHRLAVGTADGQLGVWRSCPHHNGDFLPWHRHYLRAFEEIAALYAGPPNDVPFAIPYWDYTRTPILPDVFRFGRLAQVVNPLLDLTRNPEFNDALRPAALEGLDWDRPMHASVLVGDVNSFSDLITVPHDEVHVTVGRRNGMGSVAYAARDPIFWLHHSTVDWLWESWRDNTATPDPTDSGWLTRRYGFVGADLTYKEMSMGAASRDTLLLGYNYDRLKPVARDRSLIPPRRPRPFADVPIIAESRSDAAALVVNDRPAVVRLSQSPTGPQPFSSDSQDRLFLELEGVTASATPSGIYRVYLNRPENATEADSRATRVGSFTFFSRHREEGPFDVAFDVTEVVATRGIANGIVVTVEPIRVDGGATVVIAKFRLVAL